MNRKKERWIQHYGGSQQILLVGEGDFSFFACLAKAFGSAENKVATSLDSQGIRVSTCISCMCSQLHIQIRNTFSEFEIWIIV